MYHYASVTKKKEKQSTINIKNNECYLLSMHLMSILQVELWNHFLIMFDPKFDTV